MHDVLNVFMCTGFTRGSNQYFTKPSPVRQGDYLEFLGGWCGARSGAAGSSRRCRLAACAQSVCGRRARGECGRRLVTRAASLSTPGAAEIDLLVALSTCPQGDVSVACGTGKAPQCYPLGVQVGGSWPPSESVRAACQPSRVGGSVSFSCRLLSRWTG